MNRRLLIRITTPTVLLGLALFATCLVSAWYVNRLERNLLHILSQNVTSMEAAQELEIRVRQMRIHSFLYLVEPTRERLQPITLAHERFEEALEVARGTANTPQELQCVQAIEAGYRKYQDELAQLRADVDRDGPRTDVGKVFDNHPIRHVTDPCHDLVHLNKEEMEATARESERVSRQANVVALLLGLGGPIGGLLIGYNVARGLSRSIFNLSVRVQGMAERLDSESASVRVTVDGDIDNLDQQVQKVVSRVEEVTARLQRQQHSMLRAEQLAAVGQLAAGVAHEVRNPLTSIKLLVEAALRPGRGMPLTAEDLQVIHGEVTRLEQTVQAFLDFARLPKPWPCACDLAQVVSQAVDLVRVRARQLGVSVSVKTRDTGDTTPPREPVPCYADAAQLRTVLVNLFLNALDAMPTGGHLEVTLEPGADGRCELTVADTGPGISAEIAGRLFTPFTSTKPTGTGLGLSISRRILEEHGGQLTAANRPDGGACFTLRLPAPPPSQESPSWKPVLALTEANHADPVGR